MPAERLSMRKVRDVLRLKHTLGMSFRQNQRSDGRRQDGGRGSTCGDYCPERRKRGSICEICQLAIVQ